MSHHPVHAHAHGHSHGLVDRSLTRSRAGLRVVLVSLAVLGLTALVQSAICVAAGAPVADPVIGLVITALILRITWQSWRIVSASGRER